MYFHCSVVTLSLAVYLYRCLSIGRHWMTETLPFPFCLLSLLPFPSSLLPSIVLRMYWAGQKFCSGFSVRSLWKNPNEPFVCAQLLSCVQPFLTPWTVACLAPLTTGFSRQESWSRLPFSIKPRDRTHVSYLLH